MQDLGSENLVLNLLTLAALVTALGVLVKFALSARRMIKLVGQFLDDWTGQPSRPGHARQPGIPERLAALEVGQAEIRTELKPNGGATLRDAVNRIPPNPTQ